VKKNLRKSMNMPGNNVTKSTSHHTNTGNPKRKRKDSDSSSKLDNFYTSPLKSYSKSVAVSMISRNGEKNLSKM
jgi:hypothetical protein